MTRTPTTPAVLRRRRSISVAVLALVTVALVGAAVNTLGLVGAGPHRDSGAGDSATSTLAAPDRTTTVRPASRQPLAHGAPGTGEEGQGSQGVTVFDGKAPSVANLDPALLAALKEAALDARDDGIEFDVNSGWRSAAYQQQLLDEAIARYGSEAEARKWVATPETSEHVLGDAVDLGPSKATTWLSGHGAAYGLCQIYRNERWHYELRPAAAREGCPALYADPTRDPRMQQ